MKKFKLNLQIITTLLLVTGCSQNRVIFKPIDINASEPSIINVLFSAENEDGKPITDLVRFVR